LAKTTASNCTEAEMSEALRKARELQDRYEISDEELKLTREEKVMLHRESKADVLDPDGIKWKLAHGVSRFCNVRIYRSDAKSGLKFLGFKSDIDYAVW